jgi:hypothetical protein
LELVKEIKREEGKQIAYFDADLVNSDGLIFQIDRNNSISHEINIVTTVFYDSYDEEEEVADKNGEDSDFEDPEYGNPDLKFMKHRVQQYPRVTQEEDTYNKIMMKYDFRCYGCKSKDDRRQ